MSENLIPLFTGHPSWYALNSFKEIGNCRISVNDDGSFTAHGCVNGTSGELYVFRILTDESDGGPNHTTDLLLQKGVTYKFDLEGDQTPGFKACYLAGLSNARGSYKFAGVGETFSIDPNDVDLSGYVYIYFRLDPSVTYDHYTFAPVLYEYHDENENSSSSNTEESSENRQLELSELFTGTGKCQLDAEQFGAGRIFWRVRDYDSNGAQGEWSDVASFFIYGTSDAESLASDSKPFTTVTWTASGQIAYWVRVDGYLHYGPYHGAESRFTLPEPLEDGEHTIEVKIQNNLGLLGAWTAIPIHVQNVPSPGAEDGLPLFIEADIDAALQWRNEYQANAAECLVYRDQRLIKRLEKWESRYTDRTVLGRHTYEVIQRLSSGDYNRYTHLPVTLSTDVTRIALYEGGPWISLLLTSERYPRNNFRQSRSVEKVRIMGAKYPVVEVSDFEEASGSYEVSWSFADREQAARFKQLFGQLVILKSRGEQVLIGILESLESSVSSQTVEYTFSIERVSVEEDLGGIPFGDDGLVPLRLTESGLYLPSAFGAVGFSLVDADVIGNGGNNLDDIYFGEMTDEQLDVRTTNPGLTDPRWYEDIAEAINDVLTGESRESSSDEEES